MPDRNENGYTPHQKLQIDRLGQPANAQLLSGLSVKKSYLERWDPVTKKLVMPQYENENEVLERLAVIHIFGARCIDVVKGLCYDQTKWDEGLQCRTCCATARACFSHPSLEEIWADVQACAQAAAVAAGGIALLTNLAVAGVVFKEAFYGCIVAKVGEWTKAIQIDINVIETCGGWHWCVKE